MRRLTPVSLLACLAVGLMLGSGYAFAAGDRPAAVASVQPVAPAVVAPGDVDPNCVVTDGNVYAIGPDGSGGAYIGGAFSQVGTPTGGYIPIDAATGKAKGTFPKVAGTVSAIASDGAGGFYVGGTFSGVGGLARDNIAHVLANGTVDPTWNPGVNGPVLAIATSGTTVYVGGQFLEAGGKLRWFMAALDASPGSTGTATAWDPHPNAIVDALAVSGNTVYAGGTFSTIGGQTRSCVAALGSLTGTATAWQPDANFGVNALVASGTTVYVGGYFTNVGGQPRNHIAALDASAASTGTATNWYPTLIGNSVNALSVSGSVIYVGGDFTFIGGQPRTSIAAVDPSTGLATAWHPDANGSVSVLYRSGTTVYAGGAFTSVGGKSRNRIAALDASAASTGTATAWDPDANGAVNAFAVSGTTVYAGGAFTFIGGGVARNNIAHVLASGAVDPAWDPSASGDVNALAVSGSTVYAGGAFTTVGGRSKDYLAALDASAGSTGTATNWNPSPTGVVNALAVSGSTVYAGGDFGFIGGQPRSRIAGLGSSTGTATTFNPGANALVRALVVSGTTVYVGGDFTWVSGKGRRYIAALDASTGSTGAATAFDPSADTSVRALAVSGSTVYAGGIFTSIGGQPRKYIAALDASAGSTGTATSWDPGPSDIVYALAVSGPTVYAGGNFLSIGGQPRNHIAALDASGMTTGAATAWNPNAGVTVRTLAVSGSTLYAGGPFTFIGGQPQSHLARFPTPDTIPPGPVTNLSATPGDGQVALTWVNPASDYAKTRVLRSTSSFATTATPTGGQTQVFDAAGTAVTDTGLTNGQRCYYTAFACDAAGNWSVPATIMATPTAPPDTTPPGPVTRLAAYPGNRQAALAWSNPATDYAATRILRSTAGFATAPTATATQSQVYEGTARTLAQTGLVNARTYYYTAFARDAAGNWSSRAIVTARPAAKATLSRPLLSVKTPRRGRFFTISGTIRPAHLASAKVTLSIYLKVGKRYRLKRTVTASVAAKATTYRAKLKLAAGTYYVVARHKDANHLLSTSARRYFLVR